MFSCQLIPKILRSDSCMVIETCYLKKSRKIIILIKLVRIRLKGAIFYGKIAQCLLNQYLVKNNNLY